MVFIEWRKEGDKLVVSLKRGEKIVVTLNEFFERSGIKGGFMQGIGGLDEAEIAFYSLEEKTYHSKKYSQDLELVSLLGTITETGLHAHVVISDREMKCYAGHLMDARIAVAGEFFITEMKKIRRAENKFTGLKHVEL